MGDSAVPACSFLNLAHFDDAAVPVLAHRMMLDTKAKYAGVSGVQMIEEALGKIPVPR